MNNKYSSSAKYMTSSGYKYKGFITLSGGYLIFNNEDEIITKLDKEDISSFKIKNNFFKKNISIRVNGKNHNFQTKNKLIKQIINFIKN
ncbi:MAG: hypothetical protein K8R54_16130 [Bacteroidales bacterium]|nr:hypothetical protein [Bacteroidales bacterium]